MDESPAVYAKHPAIDAGSEFRLDHVVGVRRLELDRALQRIGESEDDLMDLYLEDLPNEVGIKAWLLDLEFVRVMKKIRDAGTPMTLRLVWVNGVQIEMKWLVKVHPPVSSASVHLAYVTLVAVPTAVQKQPIGFSPGGSERAT